LGNQQFNADSIRIYPNPTTGVLQVSEGIDILKVSVYNMLGMRVSERLDLSGQASGVYFVNLETGFGTIVKKIVKQ
jgi:hypothetical protein